VKNKGGWWDLREFAGREVNSFGGARGKGNPSKTERESS